ncbi:MAG: sugar transferase [Paenibacillaceae bacterium]|jgi:lipopolysaccharide/colanic/teichoic acid biosynthesis glycosyltransferase|nr:sugar transferase [Paenibacillaceae bacterium]
MSVQNTREEFEYAIRSGNYHRKAGTVIYLKQEKKAFEAVKRSVDAVLSLIALILLLPLFGVLALLIKLEDPKGTVFFKQSRVGKDGKLFPIFKFRSMVSNAEELKKQLMEQNEASGAMFKMKHDPRVTKVGRLLRKTSLDEMPQLWNVLSGHMSLVGPRPPLPDEVAEYTAYEKRRLSVTPGCTGLWQVSGRSSIGFKEMVELDLAYIRERTLWMDIKIMARTVLMLVGSKDAY